MAQVSRNTLAGLTTRQVVTEASKSGAITIVCKWAELSQIIAPDKRPILYLSKL
jgi:hypothetical protein